MLEQRAEAIVRDLQRDRIARIVATLGGTAGIAAEPTQGGVLLSGRALVRRWLSDPALRFAASIAK